jgi:methyl-accepting chemotaxis protein
MLNKFHLRSKILIALAALSVLPLIAALFFVSGLTGKLINRDMQQLAEKTGNFAALSTTASRQETGNYISLLSSSADIVNAVFYASLTGDAEQMYDLIGNARENYQFDLLEVYTPGGESLVRFGRDGLEQNGAAEARHPLVRRGLAGETTSALTSASGRLAVMVATPVKLQEQMVGLLVGTIFLDDAFASRIKELSGVEVAFSDRGAIVAGSHPQLKTVDAKEITPEGRTEVSLGNVSHRLFKQSLEGEEYEIILALDRSDEIASYRSVRSLLGLILLVAAGLALGVGFTLSRTIVQPLSRVVDSLKEIAEGEGDLTRTLPVASRDEVGELAANFNLFIHRLREMVGRTRTVSEDLQGATEKIRHSSQVVSAGAVRQFAALDESFQAIQGIETSITGIAGNTGSLLHEVEESSSATLELGSTTAEIALQVDRLFAIVDQVSTSITEMSTAGQQIASNLEALSSSTDVSASSITEMDASIRQIEENAERTKLLAEEAVLDSQRGREAVHRTIEGIGSIREMVSDATSLIQDLGQQSNAIGGILTVIDDVADQTNLLALNAAIIAAQAGEHGRGFAVVAEEIRGLASRTAVSTREIGDIIGRLQSGVKRVVEVMIAGNEQVKEEVNRSREAGEALEKIRTSTEKSTEEVRNIVRTTQEQAKGSKMITQSVNHIATMLLQLSSATRQQTVETEQLARASETMHEIASQVKNSTGEQVRGSQQIAASMEEVRRMAELINHATQEQTSRSSQAVRAVSQIRVVAEEYTSRTAELDGVVIALAEQADALKKEVGAFRS